MHVRRHPTPFPRFFALLLVVVLTAVAGACGEDETVDSGSSSTTTGPDTSGPTTTAGGPVTSGPGGEVLAGTLDQSWGCGYGFRASDEAQTVGVVIEWDAGVGSDDAPAAAEEVILPDEGWRADVWFGENLFANWCNDVIDSNAPQQDLAETWPIVEGTFSHDAPASEGCGGGGVEAHLTGGVAERPDGSQVVIPELDLVNESWGCFAG